MGNRIVTFDELAGDNVLEIGAGRPRSEGTELPVLKVADVLEGRVQAPSQTGESTISPQIMGPKVSRPGDVVLTTKGTVGRVAIMPSVGPTFAYSPQLCYFRPVENGPLHSRYLYYWFKSAEFSGQAAALKGQTDMADFMSLRDMTSLTMTLPNVTEQRAIAEVLGALDDKIAANDRAQQVAGELARASFDRAAKSGVKHIVHDVATLVARGVAPKYADNNGIAVLNQKCVRDQWVSLEPARATLPSSVRDNKLLRQHDVLVNSTGFGTLGRVARWARNMDATVDSHISIVRFDADIVDPVCAGFGLLRLEKQIEGLAEGSTGQTELRRDLLAGLEICVPGKEEQRAVGAELAALDAHALALEDENDRLSATRDELLPLLMSGKIRVRDAEKVVEEVV